MVTAVKSKNRFLETEQAKHLAKVELGPARKCSMCHNCGADGVTIDGAHVFNDGQYRDLNTWLIEEGMLFIAIAGLCRLCHIRFDGSKSSPRPLWSKLLLLISHGPGPMNIKGLNCLVLAKKFRDENGGQIKWRRR